MMEKDEKISEELVEVIELFHDILKTEKDGMDGLGSVRSWIDADLFEYFDIIFDNKKESIVGEDLKKQILDTLIKECPDFFSDKINIIYLKLLNLYEKYIKKHGENQELYYIMDRFSPSQKSLNDVNKKLDDIISRTFGESFLAKFIKEEDLHKDVMGKYFLVDHLGKFLVAENKKKEELDEDYIDDEDRENDSLFNDEYLVESVSEILDETMNLYTEDYVIDMISDNRIDDFVEVIRHLDCLSLPSLFCNVYGNSLNFEEKNIITSELDFSQKETFAAIVEGKKR